jgi:hypothetical protein
MAYQVVQSAFAQEGPDWNKGLPKQYKSMWLVHDANRPKPVTVTPGSTPGAPPSDAIALFDGTDASQWETTNRDKKKMWDVRDGFLEVNNTRSIRTKQAFGDCQLHIEYRAPTPPQKHSQARGNSGLIFMEQYEIQVVDNYENPTYSDGYIGAVYGQHPPLVNPSRKPGEWQTYDIVFRAPRFGDDGKIAEPARFTVMLNGVFVQNWAEVYGRVTYRGLAEYGKHDPRGKLVLQDHGDNQRVRFRNIWIRDLDLSPEAIDNQIAKK